MISLRVALPCKLSDFSVRSCVMIRRPTLKTVQTAHSKIVKKAHLQKEEEEEEVRSVRVRWRAASAGALKISGPKLRSERAHRNRPLRSRSPRDRREGPYLNVDDPRV